LNDLCLPWYYCYKLVWANGTNHLPGLFLKLKKIVHRFPKKILKAKNHSKRMVFKANSLLLKNLFCFTKLNFLDPSFLGPIFFLAT
jgi:hypothetical protein